MKSILRAECGKAVVSPLFAVALLIGCFFCVADFACAVMDDVAGGLTQVSTTSCFSEWISVRYYTPYAILFYRLVPFLAVLPFGWSLAQERKSGYIYQLYWRASRYKVFFAKVIAGFLSGGMVVAIPQILNLLLFATMFPASVPDVVSAISIGIFDDNIWADCFYSLPLLYVFLYIAMDFVLCGLWASFVLTLGILTTNRVMVLAAPYLGLILLQFVNERIFLALGGIRGLQLSLFENLHAYSVQYVQNGWIILGEAALLGLAVLAFCVFGARRSEL